ncbi:MAG TPA: 4Fe-4S binding protein [Candidatus Omnitrophota bacterium]|nr:4Fe-4S binding protein [Candidatus Omnitrophota bacterium]HQJ16118.1 4Fe-4S binding protein [Candidatus Omnitrophota bacterium]
MARVEIDRQRCKGCYLCVSACPKGCLAIDASLNKKGCKPVVFKQGASCGGCCLCAVMCPDCCIEVFKE